MDTSKLDILIMCAVLATSQRERDKAPLTYSWCLLILIRKTNFPSKN
jgi:hypothetical protein